MIGFSPHTIRAWERRHNILKPHRTPSGQRRYTAEDVELLREVVNGVVVRGLSLKVAVRAAQGTLAVAADVSPDARRPGRGGVKAIPTTDAPWRSVADCMPQVVAIVDVAGRIVDANVALAAAAGHMREQLRGMRFVDFADPYDRAKAVVALRPPFQLRRGWELNLRLRSCRGLFSFDCLPVKVEDQPLLILIGHDLCRGDARVPL